ncbi:RanGTP-binding protein-domain-containing protein [Xylariales sp. PMI_506]|nr:RanGTP-binding protein-domain-containing protein [Xylariales sp. PMI_506]
MDAFLSKLSYHATSYAIRSCLAITSRVVIQHGSRLLKTVEDDSLKSELATLQRRLARKIELISPILESVEFRFSRGNSALEAVVRTARELQEDIDAVAQRLQDATLTNDQSGLGPARSLTPKRRAELLLIITEIKELIVSIDDAVPLVNLWVSAVGGLQPEPATFSPSRLLQASMLMNVGDTQYILDTDQPMQIGPNFTLSLYMLFRGHATAQGGEAYGIEEGQRKPIWQEVAHKTRVRLIRVPPSQRIVTPEDSFLNDQRKSPAYSYELQLVEDLDDGRVHTFEDGTAHPGPFDGVSLAGIREHIPVGQISKIFYADVGRILNIKHDDIASSSPVLLLKREPQQILKIQPRSNIAASDQEESESVYNAANDSRAIVDLDTSGYESQRGANDQILGGAQVAGIESDSYHGLTPIQVGTNKCSQWSIPQNLDPEWLALEVFTGDEPQEGSAADEDETDVLPDDSDCQSAISRNQMPQTPVPTINNNLVNQLHRMSIASNHSLSSTTSSYLQTPGPDSWEPTETKSIISDELSQRPAPLSPTLIERSPFSAIKTSLSLLEMLLRLASLQEFEQTTHLAIPDHVLRFYLEQSGSDSDLRGQKRGWAGHGDAQGSSKVGFDPSTDISHGDRGPVGRL